MNELVTEFKHLEKICNEIYSEQHGVTLYINEMEQESGYSTRTITGWDRDLASLKHVRHIRNLYAHEDDDLIDFEEADVAFIKDFHQRILNGQDPLTLLRKQRESSTQIRRNTVHQNKVSFTVQSEDSIIAGNEENPKKSEVTQTIIWGVVLGLLIIILLIESYVQ